MDKKIILVIVIVVMVVIVMNQKKEAGVGICLAMADCSQYTVSSWVYKNPNVGPSAIGSCCVVSEGESSTICTNTGFTELYATCIKTITYSQFLSSKSSYISGDSLTNFIYYANQWVV